VAAGSISVFIGAFVGVISGYVGGAVDVGLMRTTDYMIAIPQLPLMIVVGLAVGTSLPTIVLIIGLLSWMQSARVIRSAVLSYRERVFVKRVQIVGGGTIWTLRRHILPQVTPLIVATGVVAMSNAVFTQAALAFMGVGDPTSISWGTMIANAYDRSAATANAWWVIVPPGVCIALLILCTVIIGRALESSFNPRLDAPHISAHRWQLR
jgi:peptide/nickel transport system permease protein